jgi:CRISPR-associated endonuclease/helicase Cas3
MSNQALVENTFIAHVKPGGVCGFELHGLEDHLKDVSILASQFGAKFGNGDWASLAGLWHDLGKYSAEFQARIKRVSGYDPTAHLEGQIGKVDHSTAGAIHAMNQLRKRGRIVAYFIAGHHAGLADWSSAEAGNSALAHRLNHTELLDRVNRQAPPNEIMLASSPSSKPPGGSPHLWIRLLFSCLVDADFLDTESFMNAERRELRQRGCETVETLKGKLIEHVQSLGQQAEATIVNEARADVLRQCSEKAMLSPGLFSLTVPTGGGKTLSSMIFALEHAVKYNKARIIYAIPYTSIVEQTANIFKGVFGEVVVEHHSNLDPSASADVN